MQSVCKCMLMEVENMHAECTVIQVLSNVLDCLLRFSSRIVIRCWGDSRYIRKGGQPTLIISQAGWKFAQCFTQVFTTISLLYVFLTETSTSVEMHHQGTNLLIIKVIFHT